VGSINDPGQCGASFAMKTGRIHPAASGLPIALAHQDFPAKRYPTTPYPTQTYPTKTWLG
jgi:hypothetical protein